MVDEKRVVQFVKKTVENIAIQLGEADHELGKEGEDLWLMKEEAHDVVKKFSELYEEAIQLRDQASHYLQKAKEKELIDELSSIGFLYRLYAQWYEDLAILLKEPFDQVVPDWEKIREVATEGREDLSRELESHFLASEKESFFRPKHEE
jgi:archaellum component FlaC